MTKSTRLTVFGQLPNGRWRCCVELPVSEEEYNGQDSAVTSQTSSVASLAETNEEERRTTSNPGNVVDKNARTLQLHIGSVPSSLLVELDTVCHHKDMAVPKVNVMEDGTPTVSPESTPVQLSPAPSPPGSPYSPHRCVQRKALEEKTPTQSHWKYFSDENSGEKGILEHIRFPSPPSTPSSTVTSRSTSPSQSLEGSLEMLNLDTADEGDPPQDSESDVPVTYIGGESEDDRQETVIDNFDGLTEKNADEAVTVKRRQKSEYPLFINCLSGKEFNVL